MSNRNILVLGAGLSSSYLIKYLAQHAKKFDYTLTVADASANLVQQKIKKYKQVIGLTLDIDDADKLNQAIAGSHTVISLLPPQLHVKVAKVCIKEKKHLLTASYVSNEMQQLHAQALQADVLLLNELGLDPGIDHLSAMKLIHEIKQSGGEITGFKSYCGGLVSPEADNNPWNYKFTWNPKNVVLAGQSTATYLENGQIKFIPPGRIFTQIQEVLIPELGKFESYANRNSLGYIKPYGIEQAKNVFRGTLRRKGFCSAWNILVQLGLTDDNLVVTNSETLTNRQFICSFIPGASCQNIEKQFCNFFHITPQSNLFKKIQWLGLFENTPIGLKQASAADILLHILKQKWVLQDDEPDMIVMKHEITYSLNGKNHKIHSSLAVKGETKELTAMAKTVGLPLAITAIFMLDDKIKLRGVQIPVFEEIYQPVLKELAKNGIRFNEY